MYLKSSWCTTMAEIEMTHAEYVYLQISCQDLSMDVMAIYHPPSSNANLFLKELSKALVFCRRLQPKYHGFIATYRV